MSMSNLKRFLATGLTVTLLAAAGWTLLAAPAVAQDTSATGNTALQTDFARQMQVMRGQMMQLRATQDPAKRNRLLDAHMHSMQNTLHMMMGQGGMGRGAGMGPGGMQGGAGMGPGMMNRGGMGGAGGMMSNGRMMQMMMGQMMQHQQAMQGLKCASQAAD